MPDCRSCDHDRMISPGLPQTYYDPAEPPDFECEIYGDDRPEECDEYKPRREEDFDV